MKLTGKRQSKNIIDRREETATRFYGKKRVAEEVTAEMMREDEPSTAQRARERAAYKQYRSYRKRLLGGQ